MTLKEFIEELQEKKDQNKEVVIISKNLSEFEPKVKIMLNNENDITSGIKKCLK